MGRASSGVVRTDMAHQRIDRVDPRQARVWCSGPCTQFPLSSPRGHRVGGTCRPRQGYLPGHRFGTLSERQPMTTPQAEPWRWDESTWRRHVEHVRAGRSLKPTTWPGGARVAVALSFDSDHETIPLRD